MPPTSAPDDHEVHGLAVGAVAARLGVSTATLRSWGTRYGLTPALHSAGGHRRYSASDVDRLIRMQSLVSAGMSPALAARTVLTANTTQDRESLRAVEAVAGRQQGLDGQQSGAARTRSRPGGPGGRVLAIPGGSPAARGLARAASRLDTTAMASIITGHLDDAGASATWDELLRPVLVAAGTAWARTGAGIEIEHVLSETIIEALRVYRSRKDHPRPGPPVLLACSAEELHVLPLHVVAAALAEWRVPTMLLGARVPGTALAAAVRRTRAAAVFLWRQRASTADTESAALIPMRPAVLVVVGGPGWDGVHLPSAVRRVPSLDSAVTLLRAAAER